MSNQSSETGWHLIANEGGFDLRWRGHEFDAQAGEHLPIAIESAFRLHPDCRSISLQSSGFAGAKVPSCWGTAVDGNPQAFVVLRDMFYQCPQYWLPAAADTGAYPLHYVLTQDRRHPLRPPKPDGVVYRRHIPWLDKLISFRTVAVESDLPTFNRWMNDPVVAQFWEAAGDMATHRDYLLGIASDPHVLGLIGCFDDEPFGYFEVYWAKEDRIAPFCEATDHDRGWHVLVGEEKYRGKAFVTAWMPSMSHYLFLDDCRTQRIVIEPRHDNKKMIKNLSRSGYALVKEFDFPHKRAMLGVLLRERFFAEGLWWPGGD